MTTTKTVWQNLKSTDERKPAAMAAIRKAAGVTGGKVTCVQVSKDGTRVRGNVLTLAMSLYTGGYRRAPRSFTDLGTFEAVL